MTTHATCRGAAAAAWETCPAPEEGEIATGLALRIASRDAMAEAQLVARYSGSILRQLRRCGAAPELAEDLRKETFRIALQRLRRRGLAEPARLAGFLCGTARNLERAERRKELRRRTGGLDPLDLAAAPDPAPGPLRAMLDGERASLVRRSIGRLATARDRQLLIRFYLREEAKPRICADLGLDSLHFNRVLFRARRRLQKVLQE